MKDRIALRKLYEMIKESFPECEHNEGNYIQIILDSLSRDPSRTGSLSREINSVGLEYSLHRNFPLNDFMYGSFRYLRELKVDEDALEEFWREFRDGKEAELFED